jgi:hypothetical protein
MVTTTRPVASADRLAFRAAVHGEVIQPGDPAYDGARALFNGGVDKHPAVIVRCVDVHDVQLALAYAQEHGLRIAVRGGGHSIAGHSSVDDGLVIDLSQMKAISVNPTERTATAQPGVLLGELDAATQEFGLAVPAGTISHTGIAGLTLGGGTGWLMRKHGLTIDNLLSVEIVTADGALRRASADEHPDLFWGVRGAGANLGVVVSFEYRLHPVGPLVFGGPLVYTMDKAPEVMRLYRRYMETAPDELTTFLIFLTVPPVAPFPPHLHGQRVIAIDTCYVGPVAKGDEVIAPLRTEVTPDIDLAGPIPYTVRQSLTDDFARHGMDGYHKGTNLNGLSDEVISRLIDGFSRVTNPSTVIHVARMGGAVARVGSDATAFGNRTAPYFCWILGLWEKDPERTEEHRNWVREVAEAVEIDAAEGVYINVISDDEERGAVGAYGRVVYDWLVRVKTKYDPTNVFRGNHNIKPKVNSEWYFESPAAHRRRGGSRALPRPQGRNGVAEAASRSALPPVGHGRG